MGKNTSESDNGFLDEFAEETEQSSEPDRFTTDNYISKMDEIIQENGGKAEETKKGTSLEDEILPDLTPVAEEDYFDEADSIYDEEDAFVEDDDLDAVEQTGPESVPVWETLKVDPEEPEKGEEPSEAAEAGTGSEENPAEAEEEAPAGAALAEAPETVPEEEPKKRKKLTGLWVTLACIAALCVVYAVLCVKGDTVEIDTQYLVNDVNITGLSAEEASAAVQKDFETAYADSEYEVDVEGDTYNVPIFSYLKIDASKEIEKALAYDRGPWISRGLRYIQSLVSAVEYEEFTVKPVLEDTDGLLNAVTKVSDAVYVAAKDPGWSEENDILSLTAGVTGKSVDPKEICDKIAAEIAENRFSGTVTMEYKLDKPKEIDADKIAEEVYKAPEDATYKLENNELVVEDSKNGREVSAEEIKEALAKAEEGTTVTVKMKEIEPELSADHLREILLADRLSGYAVVDGGSWTQINNQSLAAEAINGAIILPGEEFSFNELVGDTTEEKGYVEDYAYEENQLVTQFGGGVCRVASTIYAAVLYTNLEVVERYNHTSPVHYLPYGMDATVSYPEPDLRFLNNRKYPIKIEIYIGDDDYLHASIYGTKEEDEPYVDVELDFENDMLVHTYRNYYTEEGGELLYTEFMHTSSYRELKPIETPTPEPTPAPEQSQTPEETTPQEETPSDEGGGEENPGDGGESENGGGAEEGGGEDAGDGSEEGGE